MPEPQHRVAATAAGGSRHPRSARGAWTIVALFAVGGMVLAGLFLSPRARPPAAPAGVPPGVPGAPLCFVTCDLRGGPHTVESVAAEVRAVSSPGSRDESCGDIVPDYVLLVGVEADEITDLAAGLGMQGSYHPQLFQRAGPARGGEPVGVCLLSRLPLYEGARIGTGAGPTAGVAAVSVVGGRKFFVACVDLEAGAGEESTAALLRWSEQVRPIPVVVGGAFGPGALERLSNEAGFRDIGVAGGADGSRGPADAGSPLLATPHWATVAAGTATAQAAGGGKAGGCRWVICR